MPVQKKRNVVGRDQVKMMIDYMEKHSLFARGQIPKLGPQGHIKFKNMWVQLTEQLNKLGPCVLTTDKWQEKWKNLRINSKQRMAEYMHQYNKTGNNVPQTELKEDDKRICDIFGKYGIGLNVRPESGFKHGTSSINLEETKDLTMVYTINKVSYPDNNCGTNMVNETFTFKTESKTVYNWQSRKYVKPTDEQKDVLLQFMKSHVDFAVNPADATLWDEVVSLLNAFQPIRTLKAWQRCWSDGIKAAKQAESLFNSGVRSEPLSDFHMGINELFREMEYKDKDYSTENCCGDNELQLQPFKRASADQNLHLMKKLKTTNVQPLVQSSYMHPAMQGTLSPTRIPLMPLNHCTATPPRTAHIMQPTTKMTATTTQRRYSQPIVQGNNVRPSIQGMHEQQTMQGQQLYINVQPSMENKHAHATIKDTCTETRQSEIQRKPTQQSLPGILKSNEGSLLMQLRNQVPIGGVKPVSASMSAVSEAAKLKTSYFMKIFNESQQEIINTIVTRFEKQNTCEESKLEKLNKILTLCEKQNEILTSLPTTIATAIESTVRKVFEEFNASTQEPNSTNDFQESQNSEITEVPITRSSVDNTREGENSDDELLSQNIYQPKDTSVPQQQYVVDKTYESQDMLSQGMYIQEGTYLPEAVFVTPNNEEQSIDENLTYIFLTEGMLEGEEVTVQNEYNEVP